jgi:glycine cleavage system protein P-like pyridoxal-binding family
MTTPTDRIDRALSEIRKGAAWLDNNAEHVEKPKYQGFLEAVITRENVLRAVHGYTACVMESGCEGEYACLSCLPGGLEKAAANMTKSMTTAPARRLTPAEAILGAGR